MHSRRPVGLRLDGARDQELTPALLRSDTARLQMVLNRLGYDAGEIDVYPGPQTRGALLDFQAGHCLTVTGQVDYATGAALVAADGFTADCAGQAPPFGISANSPLRRGI